MFRLAYIFFTSATVWLPKILATLNVVPAKIQEAIDVRKATEYPDSEKVKYWFHCASLGEYEMALPLIKETLKSHKLDNILITFFSSSGYDQAVRGDYKSRIAYVPLDNLASVKAFYNSIEPQIAIFVRYELWYNLIREGLKRGVKFHLINGRFETNHFLFKAIGRPYLKLVKRFNKIYTSDEYSQKLLLKRDAQAVFAGDTRFDRIFEIKENSKEFARIKAFKGQKKLLILGSSWQPEEDILDSSNLHKLENLAVVIAPHDLSRAASIAARFNAKLFTNGDFNNDDNCLVLDTIGMLSEVYQYADFTLVGGGFSGKLHNTLEPAVWGCHVAFGPKIDKFPEAQDFIIAGFGYKLLKTKDYFDTIDSFMTNESKLLENKKNAMEYCKKSKGATKRILQDLKL